MPRTSIHRAESYYLSDIERQRSCIHHAPSSVHGFVQRAACRLFEARRLLGREESAELGDAIRYALRKQVPKHSTRLRAAGDEEQVRESTGFKFPVPELLNKPLFRRINDREIETWQGKERDTYDTERKEKEQGEGGVRKGEEGRYRLRGEGEKTAGPSFPVKRAQKESNLRLIWGDETWQCHLRSFHYPD